MRYLAFETSAHAASVAVVAPGVLLGEMTLNNGLTHSQKLMPAADALLKQLGLTLADLNGLVVGAGPGSFTGIRIGMATVKGLAHGAGLPVIPVSTLEGLAWNLAGAGGLVCPILDARRDQLYTALFDCREELPVRLEEDSAQSVDALAEALDTLKQPIWFTGDGIPRFREILVRRLEDRARFPQPHLWVQRASSLGMAALALPEHLTPVSFDAVRPEYLRQSQAERMAGAKHGA